MSTPTTDTSLRSPIFPTWCPGCGNFGIWASLKKAVTDLAIPQEQLVLIYGVGCSGNEADFLHCYGVHGLHGRALPLAEAVKLANHDLKVIVVAGDGDTYGEGMAHFIAACRGNHDITLLVHDNRTYGLTTGQASPTTEHGSKTKSTPTGLVEMPVNPLALALSADATFVARAYAGNIPHTTEVIKQAISHPGFAIVDIFQPCTTWNKVNTSQWYQERIYKFDPTIHNPHDLTNAWRLTQEKDKLGIGVFFENKASVPYHQQVPRLKDQPLVKQSIAKVDLAPAMAFYR